MSRIGKRILTIPENVNVDVTDNEVILRGPKGELKLDLIKTLKVVVDDNKLTVEKIKDDKFTNKMHGTTNANINNMIIGVSEGYKKGLEIIGVGNSDAETYTLSPGLEILFSPVITLSLFSAYFKVNVNVLSFTLNSVM